MSRLSPQAPDRGLFAGIPGAPTPWTRVRNLAIGVLLVALYLWSARATDFSLGRLARGVPEMGNLLIRMLPFERVDLPGGGVAWRWSNELLRQQIAFLPSVWGPLMETLRIAIVSATLGSLLAVPVALLASRNLVRYPWLYWLARGFMNLLRTIPDLVLAAVLAGAFGVGVLPGILAVTIFSFTVVAKLLSESIEAIDPGPLEAMRAVGANRLQAIAFGVVPQVLPQYIAYVLYVFEIDVRASTVLGLVGAGGIGFTLQTSLRLLNYRAAFMIILVILAVVVLIDTISNRLRERLL
ncbi:MAG: phosphonate ABC transporter, permease protein PhnE [Firmicutes bacterium]|nr:phosphonate ABC transporter, permease protein PhnE [Bacillota bacterium]